jgi:predicted ArsR family transcriptional regulator
VKEAELKLTDEDVKRIRRRVRAGERQTDLADKFGVNRKTIRRRLDALERVASERAQRIAAKRLRIQAARRSAATDE